MKLTKSFNLKEFTKSAGIIIKPSETQIFCVRILCTNILQKVRDKFGPVNITSGLRNKKSTDILIKQGYQASLTSDHFGWSSENPTATGAADFVCRCDMKLVFTWIITNLMKDVGQVIYYPEKNIIHCSNRFSNVFCAPDTRVDATRILVNKNGTFSPYDI